MAQSILEILAREHRYIENLFSQIRENPERREEFFEYLKEALIEHSRSEERVLYPQLEALADLRRLSEDAIEEHEVMDQLLNELDAKTLDSQDWISCLGMLEDNTRHHVEFEEAEIFPRLKQYFLPEELRIMGDEFERVEGRLKQVESFKGIFKNFGKTVQNRLDQYFRF